MKTILAVDDQPLQLEVLECVFSKSKACYTILKANRGVEALHILQSVSVDLIVSDYQMPSMSGADFLRQVQKNSPTTIRVLVSATVDASLIEQLSEEGVIHKFFQKPYDHDELREFVRQSLQQPSCGRGLRRD